MKKTIIMLGAVVAWVCGVFGATHEGVQLWDNGPLWAKTNIGATRADAPVAIDDTACAAKSYPAFFAQFAQLQAGERGEKGQRFVPPPICQIAALPGAEPFCAHRRWIAGP